MAVSGNSSTPNKCPGSEPPRGVAGQSRVALLLATVASVLLLGCSTAGHVDRASSSLVAGVRAGPMSRAQLALAAIVANRFGRAYARAAYLLHPPRLASATRAVQVHVRASAAHVPPTRRGVDSFVGPIRLEPKAASRLNASVVIRGENVPAIAVGFTVERTPAGWRVTSISPPG